MLLFQLPALHSILLISNCWHLKSSFFISLTILNSRLILFSLPWNRSSPTGGAPQRWSGRERLPVGSRRPELWNSFNFKKKSRNPRNPLSNRNHVLLPRCQSCIGEATDLGKKCFIDCHKSHFGSYVPSNHEVRFLRLGYLCILVMPQGVNLVKLFSIVLT